MLSNISSNNMPEVNSISANQSNKSGNVVLARKNDPGYMKSMDYDNDGVITMEDFNQYCEKNSIDGNGRLRLLTIILLSKTTSEIKKEIQEKNPQDFNDKNKETDSQFNKLEARAKQRDLLSAICAMDISKLKNPMSVESCSSKLIAILSDGDTNIDEKINNLIELSENIGMLLDFESRQLGI